MGALAAAHQAIGIVFTDVCGQAVSRWAGSHEPGSHRQHTDDLADFGLESHEVRQTFAPSLERFDLAG